MKRASSRAAITAALIAASICSPLAAKPVRVNDFAARASAWKKLAIAPPDCSGTTLPCSEVAEEAFKWARSAWGPMVVQSEAVQRAMLNAGIATLDGANDRAAALRAVGADALLAVKIIQVNTPVNARGQAESSTVSIEVRILVPDREVPIAMGQEARGAFSEWGAVQRTLRVLISEIFDGAKW